MKNQLNAFKNLVKRSFSFIKHKRDQIYLDLSECDGMCEHCDPKLKVKCFKQKGKMVEEKQC